MSEPSHMATPDYWNNKLKGMRKSAKSRGLEFNITKKIPLPTHCPIFGIKLMYGISNAPSTPTVDRIDNTKGYVDGNIEIISNLANQTKGRLSPEVLARMGLHYQKHVQWSCPLEIVDWRNQDKVSTDMALCESPHSSKKNRKFWRMFVGFVTRLVRIVGFSDS